MGKGLNLMNVGGFELNTNSVSNKIMLVEEIICLRLISKNLMSFWMIDYEYSFTIIIIVDKGPSIIMRIIKSIIRIKD